MHTVFQSLLLCQLLVVILWPAVIGVNFSRLIELSRQVRQQDDIRSMVVFSQRSFVHNLSGFELFVQSESSAVPVVLIGNDYTEPESLGPLLGFWSMALVFMDKIDNLKMLAIVNETLRHIHSSKIVFVLQTASMEHESFIIFFSTCLRLGIINVLAIYDNQVLSYEPYPRVSLKNLTFTPIEEYFPDHLYDLKGYTFYTPIQQDGARVFIYNNTDGVLKLTGVNTEIFRSFVQRHNATFDRLVNVTNQSSFEITDGLELLGAGKIDILLHTYSYFNPKLFAWSYPIAQVQWQMLIPYVGEIASYMYLILPFDSSVWICLGVAFVYISLAGYITLRYCQRFADYGSVFSRSLAQFLYMPSTAAPCTLKAVFFDMQIFCYGLILTNIYLAFLSAFLTTTVQGNQIESFDQLYRSGIKLLTTNFESGLIRHTDIFKPYYEDIFQIKEIDFVNEFRQTLNRTYAFVMADDRIKFFLGQQKYLKTKRMHVAQHTLGTYFLTFTMQMDSPFRKNFDAILLQLYQTGLYKKWETDVFDLAVATDYLQLFRPDDEDSFRPLTVSHLWVCWLMYAGGIMVGFGIFIIEVLRSTLFGY